MSSTTLVEARPDASPQSSPTTPVTKGRRRKVTAWGLPVPLLLLVFWHLGVTHAWELPFGIRMQYLPTPAEAIRRLYDIAVGGSVDDAFSGQLWINALASTSRVLQGFGLAVILGIPLGVLMGRFTLVRRALDPTLNLLRPIPVTAWAPLSLLIIGFGDRSAIFMVFLAAFFPIVLSTVSAVREVPARLLEAAAMLGTSSSAMLYKIVVPAAAPGIVGGLRVALGLSWVILVVGETVGISVGLGSMITQARDMSKTDLVVAGMICIGLAGFLADRALMAIIRLASRGRPLVK